MYDFNLAIRTLSPENILAAPMHPTRYSTQPSVSEKKFKIKT